MDIKPVAQLAQENAKPPAYLRARCRDLSVAGATVSAIKRGWGADRASLVDCADRKQAEDEFYDTRDAGLAKK